MSLVIPTDNKEYYSTHLSRSHLRYLEQNIFSYWISSSHNTYLPYGQTFDESSECYYKLILNVYFGGCVEIDTYGVNTTMDDVLISHLPTNSSKVSLRSILRIVLDAVRTKQSKGIVSGPIILTFDNKNLTKKAQHDVFWKVLEEEVLNEQNYKYVATITDAFDLSIISISELSNKILFRWGENSVEKCNLTKKDPGSSLCPPIFTPAVKSYIKTDKHWTHMNKSNTESTSSEFNLEKSLKDHVSTQIGAIAKPKKIMVVAELPKTRSGKIMRRLLRDVAENRQVGDATTLADPNVMKLISEGLNSGKSED